jgi:bacitracin synthase 2
MNRYKDYNDSSVTIQSLIKIHATNTPEKVALIDGNTKMSYKELDLLTDSIALNLLENDKITNESIIGVLINKSYKYIVASLSILKTGARILHLDEDYPQETLNYIISEASPLVIFTCNNLIESIPEGNNFISLDEKIDWTVNTEKQLVIHTNHSKTAIIGYTSGTTSRPKGVEVSHRACIYSFNKFWEQTCNIKDVQNFGYITYLAWDTFSPLVTGATGIIIQTEANTNMNLLYQSLIKYKINNAFFTPSLLDKFLNSLPLEDLKRAFKNINVIWIGGEIVKKNTINTLYKVKPSISLINNYGPTECFVVSQGEIKTSEVKKESIVNAGYILPELEYKLLDDNKKDTTKEGRGYLYITGPALANNYFANTKLTNEKFVRIDGKIYYETSDYCEVDKDRKITILGRNSFIFNDLEGRSLPTSLLENEILDNVNIEDCVIVTDYDSNSETKVHTFVLNTSEKLRRDVSKIIEKHTNNFEVINVSEIPVKAASQKINYKELLAIVK